MGIKYNYTISHLEGDDRNEIDYNEVVASDVAPFYGQINQKESTRRNLLDLSKDDEESTDGIFNLLSLNNIVYFANNFTLLYANKKKKKNQSLALLKILCKGGTSGINAFKSSFLLPWDIDVKNKIKKDGTLDQQNLHLYDDDVLNEKVFQFMKSISVVAFRSSSGKGMAGYLVVPLLEKDFIMSNTIEHQRIGDVINRYINENLDTPTQIDFDSAQNRFRQLRYIPVQKERLKINKNYIEFTVDVSPAWQEVSLLVPKC